MCVCVYVCVFVCVSVCVCEDLFGNRNRSPYLSYNDRRSGIIHMRQTFAVFHKIFHGYLPIYKIIHYYKSNRAILHLYFLRLQIVDLMGNFHFQCNMLTV